MLNELKDMQQDKEMDKIADMMRSIIVANGLTMAEVAALNYYIMERAIKSPRNAKFIKEHLNLDVSNLSVDGICMMQQALIKVYISELHDS